MTDRWNPVVAIPARNEEERLPRLIEALSRQSWTKGGRRLPVTVVMNNCTDGTAQAAESAGQRYPNLRLDLVQIEYSGTDAHVGSARRLAMDRALAAAGEPADRVALLTTDADAVPAPDWVEANLAALGGGADLVGGLIIGDVREEALLGAGFQQRAALQARYARLADHLTALIDPLPFDPWPRHHDHTGASLCVRGGVYRSVGGLPVLPFREDLGFVSRARAQGFRLRHDVAVRVGVSARLEGRAQGGMADTLKAWLAAVREGAPQLVEAPEQIEKRALRRAALRSLENGGSDAAAGALLGPELLRAARRSGLHGTALVELLAPDEPDAPGTVAVEAAIAELERAIAAQEKSLAAA